jgi:hypothetical protein
MDTPARQNKISPAYFRWFIQLAQISQAISYFTGYSKV